jgi:hypothetical protein
MGSFAQNVQNSIELNSVVMGLASLERTVKNKKETNIKGSLRKGIQFEVENGNSMRVYISDNIVL